MEVRLLGNLDAIEWRALRAAFNSKPARTLKQVKLKLLVWPTAKLPSSIGSSRSHSLESYIHGHLSELSSREILHVIAR